MSILQTTIDNVEHMTIGIIKDIVKYNSTVRPDDIAIVFVDTSNDSYLLADKLESSIPREMGWAVNKAYETKRTKPDAVFISNRNNVKGLEFPFVICITENITRSYSYRNALYMMLTRSFIKTYLILSNETNVTLLGQITDGLKSINTNGFIQVIEPTEPEKEKIRTTIKQINIKQTFYEIATSVFDEMNIKKSNRKKLLEVAKLVVGEDFDYDTIKHVIEFNNKAMFGGQS